jgi:hypothetical protein
MKKGLCNICGTAGPLTRDHIFPLSTVKFDRLEVRKLITYLSCEAAQKQVARGSVDRRTLCETCNSKRLGSRYDPYLKEFGKRVASWVSARFRRDLTLPTSFRVDLKANRVVRAVVGHLLAVEPRARQAPLVRAPMPDAMREYFLDETRALPSELEIFCWLYPSDMQVVMRAAGIGRYGFKHFVVSDFMKAFPLGYWLAMDRHDSISVSLSRIPSTKSIEDDHSVELSFKNVPPVDWPENPKGLDMLLANDDMTILCKKQAV